MQPISFYQRHLDQVSRSFAFCIACLEEDLRLWISISYLLCRLLDTIEDAAWPSEEKKNLSFEAFQKFINEKPSEDEVYYWASQFSKDIPQTERELLNEASSIFLDFHSLGPQIKIKIRRGVLNMARGMIYFSKVERRRLKNLAEVNQYCFFVAGVVGEILTDLQSEKMSFIKVNNLYYLSHHFGLFLQKINLLKDQKTDEGEGRFLVPSRVQVLQSLAVNAKYAFDYIQSIPLQATSYRLFCSWSFFLGIYSLDWIQQSWTLKVIEKIPRVFTQQLLMRIQGIIDDNVALEKLFKAKFKQISSQDHLKISSDLTWFHSVYEGKLELDHLDGLGMLRS